MKDPKEMSTDEINREMRGIQSNPPTMDYFVDYCRTKGRYDALEAERNKREHISSLDEYLVAG